MQHFAECDTTDGLSQRLNRALEDLKLKCWRNDDHDADSERRQLLLILHATISGEQHVEVTLSAPEELTVLQRAPPFFLNGTDLELRKPATKQPREVLVKKDASQAISASSARLASSRNANTCWRETPG